MQFLGMTLPPASIDLPLGISFPLYRRPSLRVSVLGKGVPTTSPDTLVSVEAINNGRTPVRIEGIYASFIYSLLPTEVLFGASTSKFALRELKGTPPPPYELQPGESVTWTAGLHQVREPMAREGMSPGPHSRFFHLGTREDLERWSRRSRTANRLRNMIADLSHRRLAVTLRDDQGGLHKAKVRWEPPDFGTEPGVRAAIRK